MLFDLSTNVVTNPHVVCQAATCQSQKVTCGPERMAERGRMVARAYS